MVPTDSSKRICLICFLVLGITYLHYDTRLNLHYHHLFFRQLYFLPIVLAGFWFGLMGALATSLSITILYSPFVYMHWANFSPDDFDQLLELVLYNFAAIVPGSLREREWAEQKRMLESESLAAIGGAVAGIAHDMKTPLIAIGGFSRLVQRVFDKEDSNYQKLEIVIGETRRLEDMAKDMLDFARPPELSLCCEDLNELLSESLSIIEEEARKKKIRLECNFSEEIPSLALDSMKMQRVFINLIMNAIQASPIGEAVTVRTRRCGKNALVDIVDCGCGIPPDKRETIFTPFFTTKKEGTGLGLAIVKKIVEAHCGKVDIYQNQPRGAAFQVLLPLDAKRVPRPPKGDVYTELTSRAG